ncbi:MAG: hypothetical protein QF662_01740 [Phycisphaerae bacterium]|nr:hypothetical protein [Phycisphaerae bacterium]
MEMTMLREGKMRTSLSPYRTIKALVFDFIHRTEGHVDYDALTREVKKYFPSSAWQKSHWNYYRYQATRGRFKSLVSDEERTNLLSGKGVTSSPDVRLPPPQHGKSVSPTLARGPLPKDPEVKRIGDEILNHVRFVISEVSGEDPNLRFKLNRWIYGRLMQEEIRFKRPIKRKLWDSGMQSCEACAQEFKSLKGVEIHRKDSKLTYSLENCELVCRECHQELASRT